MNGEMIEEKTPEHIHIYVNIHKFLLNLNLTNIMLLLKYCLNYYFFFDLILCTYANVTSQIKQPKNLNNLIQ